jgi:hypothetical protein
MANVVLVVSGFESLAHLRHTWRGWPVGNRQTVSPTVAVSFIPLLGGLSESTDKLVSVGSVLTVALSSTETLPMSLSLSTYVTARSGLPSPFRSPVATARSRLLTFSRKAPTRYKSRRWSGQCKSIRRAESFADSSPCWLTR